jgi:hypothetical protein
VAPRTDAELGYQAIANRWQLIDRLASDNLHRGPMAQPVRLTALIGFR